MKKLENIAKYVAIGELKELEDNPRTITKAEFERLKKSVEKNDKFFEAHPIIASDRTGENVILSGNQRFKAAKQLGMSEVPAVVLHNLTEDEEREIIVRSNVENGEWDYDILANQWETSDLEDWGVDLPVASGMVDEMKGEKFPEKELWFKKVPFLVIFYDADSLAKLEQILGRSIETDTLDAKDL